MRSIDIEKTHRTYSIFTLDIDCALLDTTLYRKGDHMCILPCETEGRRRRRRKQPASKRHDVMAVVLSLATAEAGAGSK